MKINSEERTYLIKYILNSGKEYEVRVNTCIPYWNDISKEQQEDELKEYGKSELILEGIHLRKSNIKNIEIKEEDK